MRIDSLMLSANVESESKTGMETVIAKGSADSISVFLLEGCVSVQEKKECVQGMFSENQSLEKCCKNACTD